MARSAADLAALKAELTNDHVVNRRRRDQPQFVRVNALQARNLP